MLATISTSSARILPDGIERKLGPGRDVAALCAGHELLGALGGPAHRSVQLARRPQQQDPLGIEEVLHAEAAADVGRMEMDLARAAA